VPIEATKKLEKLISDVGRGAAQPWRAPDHHLGFPGRICSTQQCQERDRLLQRIEKDIPKLRFLK